MYSQSRGPQCCRWYGETLKYLCDKYYCKKNHNINIDSNDDNSANYNFGDNNIPLTFALLSKNDDNPEYEDQFNSIKNELNILTDEKMDDNLYNLMLEQNVWLLRGGFQAWISAYYKMADKTQESKLIADFDKKCWDIQKWQMSETENIYEYKLYHKNDW